MAPTAAAVAAADELAAMLDEPESGEGPEPLDHDHELPLSQAAAIVEFLTPYAKSSPSGDPSDPTETKILPPGPLTAAAIAKAYAILFDPARAQRQALYITRAWCRALKAGQQPTFEALLASLRALDNSIPRGFRLPQAFVDKVVKAKRRPVSASTILGTVGSDAGAFGIEQGAVVKSAAAKLEKSFPDVRAKKNANRNARRKKVSKPKRRSSRNTRLR